MLGHVEILKNYLGKHIDQIHYILPEERFILAINLFAARIKKFINCEQMLTKLNIT